MTPRMPLEQRLAKAAEIFRRLPSHLPEEVTFTWPGVLYDLYTRIIKPANKHKTLPPLNAEEKHTLEPIIKALHHLPMDEQRIIWLRAEGMRWSVIGRWIGSPASLVHSRYLQGLKSLRAHMKGQS